MCNVQERRRKRGEENLVGLLFWSYIATGEMWLTPEKFKDTYDKKVVSRKNWSIKNAEQIQLANAAYLEVNREAINLRRRVKLKGTCVDPEIKIKRRKYYHARRDKHRAYTKKYRENLTPEERANVRRVRNAWSAKNTKTNPMFALKRRLRARIKRVLRLKLEGRLIPHSKDRHRPSVEFLIWLAAKKNLGPDYLKSHQVDHLIPVVKMVLDDTDEVWRINAPENVQWLTPEENSKKSDRMPSQEEIDAHLLLVAEWRSSLASKPQELTKLKASTAK